MARRRGWHREPARHSLAARGYKTTTSKSRMSGVKLARQKKVDYGGSCPYCGYRGPFIQTKQYGVRCICDAWIDLKKGIAGRDEFSWSTVEPEDVDEV